MIISPPFLPAPGRSFLPGCAIAAGLLSVSAPVFAAPIAPSVAASPAASTPASDKPQTLLLGKTATFKLVKPWDYRVTEGFASILSTQENETLTVKALSAGPVKIRLFAPDGRTQWIVLNLVEAAPLAATLAAPKIENAANSQVVERAPSVVASPTSGQTPNINIGAATTGGSAVGGVSGVTPGTLGAATGTANASGAIAAANPGGAFGNAGFGSPLSSGATGTTGTTALTAPGLPALGGTSPAIDAASPSNMGANGPQISPSLPAPSNSAHATVDYSTLARLPKGADSGGSKQGINVMQGMARLLSFRSNVLAVFFSDPNVMDARAINARTIAVTGAGAGTSTLAVFTSRFAGDAVGQANIYRIQTVAGGAQAAMPERDPSVVERTINTALGDPRVHAAVLKLPDGSLAARLSGTVRNEAEVQAAIATASFYVPRDRVVSALYSDLNAPTLDAVMASGSTSTAPEAGLQENLRRITGNRSIELIPLPTGLAFKAEAASVEEAQSLLRLLPNLNQQVIPFIVVHGQEAGSYAAPTVPVLSGEDRQLTQKLHDVTGIDTVYAVRSSANSIACYGTVRTRTEYDTVRRYMTVMAQSSTPPALQGTSQGGSTLRPQGNEGANLPAYDITGGYTRALGLQMFVRITDPGQSSIRKVTVETSVVEISRTALKNLGVEYGSVSVLTQDVTGGTAVTTNGVNGAAGTVTSSPVVTTRTIDPTFLAGTALAGNGFAGGESLGYVNPFRARINALLSNGDARILSRPNVSAIEGAAAQITIGGERPVPKAVATQGAVGSQVEFRRFGVIISMRPTVTGDNTILLQIRADVTSPDSTYAVNIGGAIIPGESVRSVDTTLNVRPGDIVVMGGLITNEKRQTYSKVPVLGDLPVLGPLFRSKRFDNNETELAIFMTPRIDFMPATMESIEAMNRIPALPALPSREESNGILFQPTGGG